MNDPDTKEAIKEAIDACRPGTDDASLPEMSALADSLQNDEQVRGWYDRTQRSDAAIGRVFRDIPVPEGLADRLIAGVEREAGELANESSSVIGEALKEQSDLNAAASVAVPAKRRRLWRGMGICVVAVAAVVLVVFLLVPSGSRGITEEELPREVSEWIGEVAESNDWNSDFEEAPVQHYPPIRPIPHRWRVVATRYDSQATVYDVSRPGGAPAYLFCIRTKGRVVGLRDVPPWDPQWTTGGVAIGAWQGTGIVYVLAVKGREEDYQSYIGPRPDIG
jgi:hypothetical protein